jgi:hypothetical protein
MHIADFNNAVQDAERTAQRFISAVHLVTRELLVNLKGLDVTTPTEQLIPPSTAPQVIAKESCQGAWGQPCCLTGAQAEHLWSLPGATAACHARIRPHPHGLCCTMRA